MRLKLLILSGFLCFQLASFAQQNMGIGTANPDPSSLLELNSTNAGFLPPRMTTAQRLAIPSPAVGLLVFDTNQNCLFYFTGTWVSLCSVSGATGPTGPSGASGPNGLNGATGPSGPAGATGPSGANGATGATGSNGVTGPSGANGATGATGANGVTGPSGANGATGANGVTGPSGANGATGATGANGATGPSGAAGATGPSGAAGATGPSGANGATGPSGPAGTTGPSGAAGATGPSGADGVTGPSGPAGATGPSGANGATGPSGPAGATGPSGADGATGPSGPAGATGPSGADGVTGPSGAAGATGPSGAAGATGPSGADGVTGPSGPAGATGPSGANGATGPSGPAGATGPSGADGVTGPSGAAGATGPSGADGVTGPSGADGATGPSGAAGATGPSGADGVTGPSGAAGATGPSGADGVTGPTGATGPTGDIGLIGPTGRDGATGADGATGVTGPTGPSGLDGSSSFCVTATTNYVPKFTSPTLICNSIIYDDGTNIGISTTTPITKLHVNGDARLGLIYPGPSGAYPGYGNFLIFSGGPAGSGTDSENSDFLNMARFNISNDVSELRTTIGDNSTGPGGLDYFTLGTVGSNFNLFAVRSDGNVGVGVRDAVTKFEVRGKSTFSRDGVAECCGNDATLVIGEAPGTSTRRASISFHNSGEAEGTLRLIQNNVSGINTNARRFQLFDNQGFNMGLELSGGLFYGINNSRTETRNDAGLQGSAGAQSGFFETSNPTNFPSGASSWWHLIDVRHDNPGNNYAMQLSGSFYDQKLYMRKTNGNATQAWSRVPNSTDAANSNGYLFFDVGAQNGTVEGSIRVEIVNGTLTVTGFNEGGTNLGVWYQLNNVANAKIVVLITNDDTANCGGSAKVSSTRTISVTNNGGAQQPSTDMGCSNSDGNNMTFMVAYNPL